MCVFRVAGSPASEEGWRGKSALPFFFNATCSFGVKCGVLHLDFEENLFPAFLQL